MIGNVSAQWKTASQIGFMGNTTLCVEDSTGNPTVNPGNGSLVNSSSTLGSDQVYGTHTAQESSQASQTATQATGAPDTTDSAAASYPTQETQGSQAAQTSEMSSSSTAIESSEATGMAQTGSGGNTMALDGSSTPANGSVMAFDGAANKMKSTLSPSLVAAVGAIVAMLVW